jgi:hypothetical protein
VLPNAVLAGAPKCGTSSLFRWLADHPDVCGSSVKETRFLLDRDDCLFQKSSNVHEHGLGAYERYFDGCDAARAKVTLEATPAYLYQRTAPDVLSTFDPQPDLLFVFRRPSERAYSQFRYLKGRARIDPSLDFRRFVERVRAGDPGIPTHGHANFALAFGRYSDYLPAWLERFPRERFHYFLFEDLRNDPQSFAKAVAARLGLEPSFYDEYAPSTENRSSRVRSAWLHRARRQAGRHVSRRTRERLKAVTAGAYALVNVESSGGRRTSDEADVLAELDAEFEPFNERLVELTALDLSSWR